jgi:hypothetical protein
VDSGDGHCHGVGDDLGLCVLSGEVELGETRQGRLRPTGSDVSQAPGGATLARDYDLIVFPAHEEYVTAHEYD